MCPAKCSRITLDIATVTYDKNDKVNSIKVNKKNDGELLYLR